MASGFRQGVILPPMPINRGAPGYATRRVWTSMRFGAAPRLSVNALRARRKTNPFFCAYLDVGTRDPSDKNSGLFAVDAEGCEQGGPTEPRFTHPQTDTSSANGTATIP